MTPDSRSEVRRASAAVWVNFSSLESRLRERGRDDIADACREAQRDAIALIREAARLSRQ